MINLISDMLATAITTAIVFIVLLACVIAVSMIYTAYPLTTMIIGSVIAIIAMLWLVGFILERKTR